MERKEAAEFLGISLRTLDRLGSEGRLKKGRALRKTRPVVVFDLDELKALKAELERQATAPKSYRRAEDAPKDTVAFRIDPHYLARLSTEGKAQGLSAGEYARRLVIRALEDTRTEEFRDEVKRLRGALGHTFYTLLVMKFGVSEREAEEFVASTIESR